MKNFRVYSENVVIVQRAWRVKMVRCASWTCCAKCLTHMLVHQRRRAFWEEYARLGKLVTPLQCLARSWLARRRAAAMRDFLRSMLEVNRYMQRHFYRGAFLSRMEVCACEPACMCHATAHRCRRQDSLLRGLKLSKAGVPADDCIDDSDSDVEDAPASPATQASHSKAKGGRALALRKAAARRTPATASPVQAALQRAADWDPSDPNFVLGASVDVYKQAHERHKRGSKCPELYSAFYEFGGVRRLRSALKLHKLTVSSHQGTGRLSRARFSKIMTAPGVIKKKRLGTKDVDLCFERAKAMEKGQASISFKQFACALVFVANIRYVEWLHRVACAPGHVGPVLSQFQESAPSPAVAWCRSPPCAASG